MKRIYKLALTGVISTVLALIFGLSAKVWSSDLPDQEAAKRWSDRKNVSQISCYFSANTDITPDTLEMFRHTLDSQLEAEAITVASENPGARLWVDCYSAEGKITLSGTKTDITADAIGIGGDFFLFHPFQLLNGAYFSGDDLMQDYCVLDEIAAWQLFGSNDIAGQMITIGGVPHMVTGVIRHPEGRLYEAAGLTGSRVYVSYDTLEQYGQSRGIKHYEVLMPNPVDNFALDKVKSGLNQTETEVEYIENNKRFSFANMLKMIRSVGTRSMNGKAIMYPFWENVARGHEDVTAIFLFLMLLCMVCPVVLVLFGIIWWWKHKKWTWKSLLTTCKSGVLKFFSKQSGVIKRRIQKKMAEDDLEDMEEIINEKMDE